jgi:hypothetical protein
MIKSFKYPKAALTVSALLALTSIQGPAFGEGAKIQMDGEITGSTCVLMGLANGSGSTQSATGLAMSLGKGDLSQTPTSPAVGQVLNGGTWAQQTIVFKQVRTPHALLLAPMEPQDGTCRPPQTAVT